MSTAAVPASAGHTLASMAQLAADKLRFAQALDAVRGVKARALAFRESAPGALARIKHASGITLAAALSSPAVYHLAIRGVRKIALTAAKAVSYGVECVSIALGHAGSLLAKAVGLVSKRGAKAVQMSTFGLTSFVTDFALVLKDIAGIYIEANFSVSYSPTVTRAVTTTGKAIVLGAILNMVTAGKVAAWLSMIPVAGPLLAGSLLSLSGAWVAFKLVWGLSGMWVIIRRPHEALAVYTGHVVPATFAQELRSEWRLAQAEAAVVEAAEQMTAQAVNEETFVAVMARAQADLTEADALVAKPTSRRRNRKRR